MAEPENDTRNKVNPVIKVTRDGPYVVPAGVPLSEQSICADPDGQSVEWKETKKFPVQEEEYHLCRCGHSQNKPFCDGSHITTRFHGTETSSNEPYAEQAQEYKGPELTLTDAESFCASARFCDRAGNAWKLAEQSADPQARQTAIEEAGHCPSGRLVAWDKDGKALEPHFKPAICLVNDVSAGKMGPIGVVGGIPVKSADGKQYEVRNRVRLCRCGKSSNKPFCDGSHLR
jgi:CDGSH-type Zn-finger protein